MKFNHVALPSRPITHRKFVYTSAKLTDIRRTFRKARLFFALQKKLNQPKQNNASS